VKEPIPLATVLKRGALPKRTASPATAALPDLSQLMKPDPAIETAARQQADALLEQARAEAEQIRQQAWQQGYADGYQAGEQQARAQLEAEYQQAYHQLQAQLQAQVAHFLGQLQAQFEQYLRHLEPQMLDLTLQIARKIVREELRQHPEHVLAIIRDALRRVQGFGQVRVRVHPLDLELARQQKATLLTVIDSLEGLEIVEDRRVEQGGCIVETAQGIYDARIGTQLDEIEQELRSALPEAS
jgi:flagellar assembly protein FliH